MESKNRLHVYSTIDTNPTLHQEFAGLLLAILNSGFPDINGPFRSFHEMAEMEPEGALLNELYAKGIPMDIIAEQYQHCAEEKFHDLCAKNHAFF